MTPVTTNLTIEWLINTILLQDLDRIIYSCGLHYIGFGIIASGIEFLGACLDDKDFNEECLSRKRFEKAIKTTFELKYHQYADKDSPYVLYKHLRCGMAHIMRPQGKVVFTTRAESIEDGTSNLMVFSVNSIDKLVIVSEDFYDDFVNACKNVKQKLESGKYSKKLSDPFLSVTALK